MTASGSAYTTLESLLLFQSLHAYGVASSVFGRISDLLKKNPDITSHKHFQSGRLSPDALRNFYLDCLRKEIEHENGANGEAQNGDLSASRKRKLPSPSLPSVQESLQHQHLIPNLVAKLYASYRKEVTDQIRDDEDRYEKLQHDLKSIERGEWDDRLREKANGRSSASKSPTLLKKSPNLAQKPIPHDANASPALNGGQLRPQGTTIAPDVVPQPVPENPGPIASQNGQLNTQNAAAVASSRKSKASGDQRRGPSTPQPIAASTPAIPNTGHPYPIPPQFQQHSHGPHSNYNGGPFVGASPHGHIPPFQDQQHGPRQPGAPQHPSRPSSSQSVTTGTPGLHHQSPPVPPYATPGTPQYGPAPGLPPSFSPVHQRFPPAPTPPHSQHVQGSHQQRTYFPHPSLQPHGHPPPQAGFMLPPFQVSPQDPSRVHPQTASTPHHAQASTPINNRQQPASRPSTQTPVAHRPGVPPVHPLVTQARGSFSTPQSARSSRGSIGTPVSAKSTWKSQNLLGTPGTPRPSIEPLDDFVPLGSRKQDQPKTKTQRKSRGKGKAQENESGKAEEGSPAPEAETDVKEPAAELQVEETTNEVQPRKGRPRRKAPPKRGRPGSIASSRAGGSVRDRSRSHSILSHTDTVAADNESQAGNTIKSERGTSVDINDAASIDTPIAKSIRRRGAAVPTPHSTRRKRNAREASLADTEDQPATPGPTRTILAPRYFSRTSAPIMQDIASHKYASTFSTAVRAKDAEGYYDIIKRPTDLKSITKAIAHGAKQVAAAASDTPLGSPGGAGGVVELPLIPENMPPKSIVNAGQLEKELMRMFVNAVMFNPGEEGVVEDAREMFNTVQQTVSSWRNVERASGRADHDGTPAAEDEEPLPSKRRKL